MIKPPRSPYGYKKLLVYQKAEDLQRETSRLTSFFSPLKTHYSLADQMNRSARSVKQNIVEGWKRNSTREYYEFLGYAVASNAELEEDYNDIIQGVYPQILRIKRVMGKKDKRGETGEGGERGLDYVETLRFYPLDTRLPPVVQNKLRAKEINFLLDRLQKSLIQKMDTEGTLSTTDRRARHRQQLWQADTWFEEMLKEKGFVRLENGRVVHKEEGNKGTRGEKREDT